MKKFFRLNERGYLLLNVVFLTLVTSFAAMILLNAAPRVKNSQSTMKLIALHLANEQLAYIEAEAEGKSVSKNFLTQAEDLTNDSFRTEDAPTVFKIDKSISDNVATVTVSWEIDGKNFSVTAERTIRVAQ